MVSDRVQGRLSTDLKVQIVQRVEAGERLSAVAEELGILRKSIYEWRKAYRALGAAGLNQKRGPKPGGERKAACARPLDELRRAQARIAGLDRVNRGQFVKREALSLNWTCLNQGGGPMPFIQGRRISLRRPRQFL